MASNKVTVRIWFPAKTMGWKGDLASWAGVGHASIRLRVSDKNYYVTWTAQGSPLAGFVLDPYQNIDSFTKKKDKEAMGHFFNSEEPTHKIRLRTKQPNSEDEGLDAEAIEAFWLERLQNRPTYSFLSRSNNCTGCVAEALRAGGLEKYVPAPSNWFVQDASSLLAWVIQAEKRLGVVEKDNEF